MAFWTTAIIIEVMFNSWSGDQSSSSRLSVNDVGFNFVISLNCVGEQQHSELVGLLSYSAEFTMHVPLRPAATPMQVAMNSSQYSIR